MKILDFGLAKAMASEGEALPDASASMSPTLTLAATQRGEILGTAAYMSPEQAKGNAVDRRTDIWAFGACLFEALAGTRTFRGGDASELLASVLLLEPDWDALPSGTPAHVERLLRRCLVKDARDRLHDIADARIELGDPNLDPRRNEGDELPTSPARRRPSAVVVAIAIAVATVSTALLFLGGLDSRQAEPVAISFDIQLPQGEELPGPPAVSPDGRRFAFATVDASGLGHLYLRSLDASELTRLASGTLVNNPFFSPDGEWVGFFSDLKLKKVSVRGGAPTELANAGLSFGGAWEEGGTIVFTPSLGEGLCRVSANGGPVETLTHPDQAGLGYAHVFPQILQPSGNILFSIWAGDGQGAGLAVAAPDGTIAVPDPRWPRGARHDVRSLSEFR